MSTLNFLVFFGSIASMYVFNILFDRFVFKKWNWQIGFSMAAMGIFLAFWAVWMSDMHADLRVAMKVPHEWKEQILAIENIEDVSRSREQEGHSFLLVGGVAERETFRYTIVNHDGSKVRGKTYVADCVIYQSADGRQRIEEVRKVREYKNPQDKIFYQNRYDKKESFYRVYL